MLPGDRRITTAEWRFVWIVIAIVLVVTSLPYIYAYWSAPADKHYMGIMLDVPDHAQYFSWMRELTHANFSSNKLTPEPNKAIFFNLLWWGLGRLGSLLGVGYPIVYQILRLVSGMLFLLLAYQVCAWFLEDRWMRRVAFLVIALTSGLGWIWVLLKYTLTSDVLYPLDVYVAEGNSFLGILGYPHFIAAALYISVFYLLWVGEAKGKLRYAVFAGLLAQFFGWQHAYDLILVYGIIGTYGLFKWLRDKHVPWYIIQSSIIVGLLSVWPALYSLVLTTQDPLWKEILKQYANAGVYTPNLLHLPILMGIPFLLALFTFIRDNPLRLKAYHDRDLFIRSWFLANFFLNYIPTDYQIHMLNGWQVPIAILSVQGLFFHIIPWFKQQFSHRLPQPLNAARLQTLGAIFLLAAILPTNLYLWSWRFLDLSRHDYPYYLYNDEMSGLEWLDHNTNPDDVVLSSLTVGQYVPALTGTYAFLAHWAQTYRFYEKVDLVSEFYTSDTPEDVRLKIVNDYSVDYVFWGPAERAIGSFDPGTETWLEQVFTSPLVKVYRVIQSP